jgi:hypothetical protein
MPRRASRSTSCLRWWRGVRECCGAAARACVPAGLLSQSERKNGWKLAEFTGDLTLDGMQRLLNHSPWDEGGCRDALRRYVACRLGDPAAVLVVDEAVS